LFHVNGQTGEANNYFSKWFFKSLIKNGVANNTGSFRTVSVAKTNPTKITSVIFSIDKVVEFRL
jgi:hypothetical protein